MTTLPFPFVAPVRGISNYRRAAATVTDGEPVRCVHEPDNAHDPNAFRIARHDGATVGYLPRNLASRAAAAGHTKLDGTVVEVLGDPGGVVQPAHRSGRQRDGTGQGGVGPHQHRRRPRHATGSNRPSRPGPTPRRDSGYLSTPRPRRTHGRYPTLTPQAGMPPKAETVRHSDGDGTVPSPSKTFLSSAGEIPR